MSRCKHERHIKKLGVEQICSTNPKKANLILGYNPSRQWWEICDEGLIITEKERTGQGTHEPYKLKLIFPEDTLEAPIASSNYAQPSQGGIRSGPRIQRARFAKPAKGRIRKEPGKIRKTERMM